MRGRCGCGRGVVREITLSAGEVLFEEGEPSETVALVLEGELEVVRRTGSREVVLGTIGPGEYAGEMGVMEGRRRAATVRARQPARLRLLDRESFFAEVVREPERARLLLLRLSERLRRADERIVHLLAPNSRVAVADPAPTLRLLPDSDRTRAHLPAEGLTITHLPFSVGRRPEPGERRPPRPVDLALPDTRPFRLSRHHFVLVQGREGPEVVDAGSTLGTAVDGIFLGEHFPRSRLVLTPGEHELVAGGMGSPWRFRLQVTPADAAA